jgi:hypothetical protein
MSVGSRYIREAGYAPFLFGNMWRCGSMGWAFGRLGYGGVQRCAVQCSAVQMWRDTGTGSVA